MGVFKEKRGVYIPPTVSQLRNGNPDVWNSFYSNALPQLHAMAERMMPGRGEDLVQDAIVGFLTQLPELPDTTNPVKYLGKSVVNGVKSTWRHEQGTPVKVVFNSDMLSLVANDKPGSTRVEDEATNNVIIGSALKGLSERQRQIAALNAAGFTDRQIADKLGITTGGVAAQLFKARTALKAFA